MSQPLRATNAERRVITGKIQVIGVSTTGRRRLLTTIDLDDYDLLTEVGTAALDLQSRIFEATDSTAPR